MNQAGLDLLKSFEGLRLEAYQDQGGVWTIGYGHTRTAHEGMVITAEFAEELLKSDLAETIRRVAALVKVFTTENERAALEVFTFNVGAGNLQSSTLLRLLNQGDYGGAADQFLAWDKVHGQVVAGLQRRRFAERALFQAA